MRVLHLTPEFPPVIWGGLGTAVGGLVNASSRYGIEVGVFLVGGVLVVGSPESAQMDYGGGHLSSCGRILSSHGQTVFGPTGVMFKQVDPTTAVEAGVRLARHWRPDVVHLHTAWLWHVAAAIREQTGVPFVFTVHSLDRVEYEHGIFLWSWETQEAAIYAADRVIALSRSEHELMVEYCPAVQQRIRIVGNGIDDVPISKRFSGNGSSAQEPLVLYCGRFVNRKGIRELLDAIPCVLEKAPNTRFVLVGGYGGGAEIERAWLADSLLPYRSRVEFTGWLTPSEVIRWYRLADILVVPSWYEPFGMVILEGMLHGLAVAASSVGGPAEILDHERTGILFPAKDAAALAEAILKLIRYPELRHRVGESGAREVREKWLWRAIAGKMNAVYLELVQKSQKQLVPGLKESKKPIPRAPAGAR
jgi:glycosyltransferase involved in cell wall biosynthesis